MNNILSTVKKIQEQLRKHHDFLTQNPDLLDAIYERLSKAKSEDEADQWLRDNDGQGNEDQYNEDDNSDDQETYEPQSNFLDNPEQQESDTDEIPQTDEDEQDPEAETEEPKIRTSQYSEWKPRADHSSENHQKMADLVSQGYSAREAERKIGGHQRFTSLGHAVETNRTHPSEPSPKMLEELKPHAKQALSDWRMGEAVSADAAKNPVKAAHGHAVATHQAAIQDYATSLKNFKASPEYSKLSMKDKFNAEQMFKKNFEMQNPEHKSKLISAAGSTADKQKEVQQAREGYLGDKDLDLITAHLHSALGGEDMTDTGKMQSVGGEGTEDSGPMAGTTSDPMSHFATKNPEYIKQIKDKLLSRMSDDQKKRLGLVDAAKTAAGHNAPVPKETKQAAPVIPAASEVRTFTPEQIAQENKKRGV